jgi:hypothetical protein
MPTRRDCGIGLLPRRGFALGQTDLLPRFLELTASYSGGNLFFTAPFFDSEFLERLVSYLPGKTNSFELIVRQPEAAREIIEYFWRRSCRSVSVRVAERLHAKVYIFESPKGDLLAVVGSHNPTVAAITQNLEAGIFVGAKSGCEEWRHLLELRNSLRASSNAYLGEITAGASRRETTHEYSHSINQ